MNENFRARIESARSGSQNRKSPDSSSETVEATEDVVLEPAEESDAFSLLSSERAQKTMLEMRFLNGNASAITYSYIVRIDFDPSRGIVLDASGYQVTLQGRNLRPIFAGLVAQRVAVISETDPLQAEAGLIDSTTVVTQIEISPLGAK